MNNQIIKLPAVILMSALSSPTIYRLIKKGEFPKQIKLSERSSGWLLSEVNKWLDDKAKARNSVEVDNETQS
ncbi:MAG: AlpA family transcriptional regulator [Candidatus Thioglobus sp.]|jgi:prophage regulatory protein